MTTIGQLPLSRLTRTERDILDFINRRTPQRWTHSLFSARKIAAAVGCTVRTVGRAMKRLESLGVVRSVKGQALSALRSALGWRPSIRRAIELVWRARTTVVAPSESARNEEDILSASTPLEMSASTALPPDPPIDASDDLKIETEDGGGRDHFEAETPPPPLEVIPPPWKPEPERDRNPERPAPRKATPEELARLDRAAARVTKDPAFPQRLRNLARARGLRRVLVAAEMAAQKAKQESVYNPFGLVLGILRTFDEDGYVPELGEDPEAKRKRVMAMILEGID